MESSTRALAASLAPGKLSGESWLDVSIRTDSPPNPVQRAELIRLGVRGVDAGANLLSARATPVDIERLADLPWVRLVSLARKLRPLSE